MKTKKNSIKQKMGKVTMIMILVSLFISGLFSTYDFFREDQRLRSDFEEMISPIADRLAPNLRDPLWVTNMSQIEILIQSEMSNKRIYAVIVREADKKIFCAMQRDKDWNIVKSDGNISGTYVIRKADIIYEGDSIGEAEIYFSTRFINNALKKLTIALLIRVLMLSFCMVSILLTVVHFFLIKPLSVVISGLSTVGNEISEASSRISVVSRELSEGAVKQASAVEETSFSFEEISSITRQNVEHANHANQLMCETASLTNEVADSMKDLIISIEEISEASKETRKIIRTIDEISFQTNLLALNAAVEAARAGQAGAGFAVVADEVRNLAMRSGASAKNITEIIETSIVRIKKGIEMVYKAGEVFTEVAGRSKKAGELFNEVVRFSREQDQGISEISTAMSKINLVTQENAARSEETTAAIEDITNQIGTMKSFVKELVILIGARKSVRIFPGSHALRGNGF